MKTRRSLRLGAVAVVGAAACLAMATERHVPGEYTTIQAAIDACVAGDEVIVADGVYTGAGNKDLDFGGRAITVRSASGDANTCIIGCEGSGRGFYFHGGETAAAVVRGFTIRNGKVNYNSPGGGHGGGVCCSESSPTVSNCTISGNAAMSYGGGLYMFRSAATIVNNTIAGNAALSQGGGLCLSSSSPTIANNTIAGNSTGYQGGGLYLDSYSSPVIANNAIVGNIASSRGGGLYLTSSPPMIANNTITGNRAFEGGGLYLDSALPTIASTIVAFNSSGVYAEHGTPTVRNSCVYGNTMYGYSGVVDPTGTNGNISTDPLFRNPNGPDHDPNTLTDNDYRLMAGSPCIDAGSNSAAPADTLDPDGDGDVTERLPFDLDGLPRFVDDSGTADCPWAPGTCGTAPIVDMGAYEFQGTTHLAGDLNCDGVISYGDISPFVRALGGQSAYEARYPNCRWLNADINGDGLVSYADINAFVRLLVGK